MGAHPDLDDFVDPSDHELNKAIKTGKRLSVCFNGSLLCLVLLSIATPFVSKIIIDCSTESTESSRGLLLLSILIVLVSGIVVPYIYNKYGGGGKLN